MSVLAELYQSARRFTVDLCAPLTAEDCAVQSMPDASPAKWHLGHTTWFFETFVLLARGAVARPIHPAYAFLFNSYYDAVGARHARAERGLLTRPSLAEILLYRQSIDELVLRCLRSGDSREDLDPELARVIVLGVEHERQHQELLLCDIKHLFASQPMRPAYRENDVPRAPLTALAPIRFIPLDAGLEWFGHDGKGFAFDNETPRHRAFVAPFAIADRLVTNGEYRQFIEDAGYERPELWLSEGFQTVQKRGWSAPLYWEKRDSDYWQMTLAGMERLRPNEPVVHVSYYESDAFARWRGVRLPTEYEWEIAARAHPIDGNFVESGRLCPAPAPSGQERAWPSAVRQLYGDVWEWTASPYVPYPGFRSLPGALGEYNGKFMCNQLVLRGGSCVTSRAHARATYRNFFGPDARWQFTGIRIAEDRV
jgi:ergothioneine biosynthesis protein EgtB